MITGVVAGEFPTPWRAACAYGLLAIVLLLTLVLPIATFWHGKPVATEALGLVGLFTGQVVLASFLVLWFLLRTRTSVRSFLRLPAGGWTWRIVEGLRVGILGWVVTMTAMIGLGILAHADMIAPRPGFAKLVIWMAQRPLALRLALIAVAMVVEEAFFRAFVQARLGLLIATLWFALSHMNYGSPMMGVGVLVIGTVLGRAYERTGDLAVCAVAHGTFDAIQLLVVLPLVAARIPA
jgi:membrane protease YdiL (CAAX protease family)